MVELALLPAHERLAELHMIQKKRKLTVEERQEREHCLDVNAAVMYDLANIKNLTDSALATNDIQWLMVLKKRKEILAKRFKGGIICG